jgi:hypothetical protein
MKLRETNSGNFKLTLTQHELSVFYSVLENVRLGNGENSDVVFEFLNEVAEADIYLDIYHVTVDVLIDNKLSEQQFTINV